jgi:Arc/MetJ family transcription regulator
MRTTLELNESLVAEAMRRTGAATKTALINEALRQVVGRQKRANLVRMAGKIKLDVDLNATRKRG